MHRYVALAIGALLVASSSHAEPSALSDDARVVVGAAGTYSFLLRAEDAFSSGTIAIDTEVGPSFGAALSYGVRVPNGVAIEIDLEWNEGFAIDQSSLVGTVSDELRTYLLTSSIGFHPLGGRFDPFVAVGGGWMRATLVDFDASDDGIALRFGAGADLWLTDHLGLRIEGRYVLPITDSVRDLDFAGPHAGLRYRF